MTAFISSRLVAIAPGDAIDRDVAVHSADNRESVTTMLNESASIGASRSPSDRAW
ncbi:MAG: hypothetical protein ABI024_04140 [Vicinamibacterales bacterium]